MRALRHSTLDQQLGTYLGNAGSSIQIPGRKASIFLSAQRH